MAHSTNKEKTMKTVAAVHYLLVVILVVLLAGCANGNVTKRDVATVAGGVGGGFIGNSLTGGSALGTIGGTLGGAYIGNQLAK
jgi:osmotically inducible lipoprotein OsmB